MKGPKRNYVVCVRAEVSSDIEIRKIYEVLRDDMAAKRGHVRIIDESGSDYLYPKEYFIPVEVPEEGVRTLQSRATISRDTATVPPAAQKTRRN